MNWGYAYDIRYLLDANFRADGSSVFGVSNKFTTTWAVGVGWNIHNESFVKNCAFIDFLKLRASAGMINIDNIPEEAYWQEIYTGGLFVSANVPNKFNVIFVEGVKSISRFVRKLAFEDFF